MAKSDLVNIDLFSPSAPPSLPAQPTALASPSKDVSDTAATDDTGLQYQRLTVHVTGRSPEARTYVSGHSNISASSAELAAAFKRTDAVHEKLAKQAAKRKAASTPTILDEALNIYLSPSGVSPLD